MEMEKLCKLVDTELDKFAAQTTLNDNMIASLYRLVDIKKDLLCIEQTQADINRGYSQRAYGLYYDDGIRYPGNSYKYMNRPRYSNMNDYDEQDMRYIHGYSGNNPMADHLQMAMNYTQDKNEREAIRNLMNQLNI